MHEFSWNIESKVKRSMKRQELVNEVVMERECVIKMSS